jgi:hypothetical protein
MKPQPALCLDGVRINEAHGTSPFVNYHPQAVEMRAQRRMRAHIVDDLAQAREQPGILEDWLAYGNPVPAQLAGVPHQPGGVGQCSHRNGAVICRHAAKLAAGDEGGPCAQVCGTQRGDHTGRSSANDDDV